MPIAVEMKVSGLAELDEAFRTLPEAVRGAIMKDALTDAGEVIERAAIAHIHRKSGETADHIHTQVQVSEQKAEGAAAIGGGRRSYVLRWLEFGTKAHKIVGGSADRILARRA